MGVPRLFPWLKKTFPKAVLHFQEGKYTLRVDCMYLDANGLLHSAAQTVFNYGENPRKIDPYADLTYEQKITKTYEKFFQLIRQVTNVVIPTKTLYIAIDGPAPLAKQAQQRFRRFAAAIKSTTSGNFDSTNITPGTLFMFELTKYLHYAIRREVAVGRWKHIEVLFSPPTVPGEGEHKIMDYMRALPDATNLTHCMFGPDGDLIMLTLASHLPKMYLFRQDQYMPGFYDLLDMGKVSIGLPPILNPKTPFEIQVSNAINDFILIGFFVGNDFLPKIQMFMYLEDGLALMLKEYQNLPPITHDGQIDVSGLAGLIRTMASAEEYYLRQQADVKPVDNRFIDHTLLRFITRITDTPGDTILDFERFSYDYYAKSQIEPGDDVRQMCLDYLRCIVWVFQYYIHGIPSWSHYYDWYYAPLMTDLANVLETITQEELEYITTFDFGEPSLPFVQLLSVIAPKNVDLLPPAFHHLMTDPESPLVVAGYYPETFVIDYEGKTKEHMGISLLPYIDVEEVKRNYQPVAESLKTKYARNTTGVLEHFRTDPLYTADYISDYGTLKGIHVRKTEVKTS